MRDLTSLAASAERCASARTSDATTAKPLPASPARAASTPAFSASRLVWKAMPSMTLMISEISLDAFDPGHGLDRAADDGTRLFGLDPGIGDGAVGTGGALGGLADGRVISSIAAAVSSRLAACCSVRCDRSSEAWRMSLAPD
jgi:hypothetical protein